MCRALVIAQLDRYKSLVYLVKETIDHTPHDELPLHEMKDALLIANYGIDEILEELRDDNKTRINAHSNKRADTLSNVFDNKTADFVSGA